MRRSINIQQDLDQIRTVEDLTEVFESIASLRIAKIRNRVVASKTFFAELWQTYQGLRIDPKKRITHEYRQKNGRTVFLAITGEGNLSGDADEQIITQLLESRNEPDKTDIVVIGNHGTIILHRHSIDPFRTFALPLSDSNFSVSDIIETLEPYQHIAVFYQTYDSLRVQKVERIELVSAVRELSEDVADTSATVSSRDYIFEPDINKIIDYMESVMLGVALIQVIMESKLAQYANRFNTMSRAKQRAKDLGGDYQRQFYHAKRAEVDERLKEIIKMVRTKGAAL
jgi:ATP synthase F1 gamma subunit